MQVIIIVRSKNEYFFFDLVKSFSDWNEVCPNVLHSEMKPSTRNDFFFPDLGNYDTAGLATYYNTAETLTRPQATTCIQSMSSAPPTLHSSPQIQTTVSNYLFHPRISEI